MITAVTGGPAKVAINVYELQESKSAQLLLASPPG
jgi:hypothetical protein